MCVFLAALDSEEKHREESWFNWLSVKELRISDGGHFCNYQIPQILNHSLGVTRGPKRVLDSVEIWHKINKHAKSDLADTNVKKFILIPGVTQGRGFL